MFDHDHDGKHEWPNGKRGHVPFEVFNFSNIMVFWHHVNYLLLLSKQQNFKQKFIFAKTTRIQ